MKIPFIKETYAQSKFKWKIKIQQERLAIKNLFLFAMIMRPNYVSLIAD